MNPTTGKNQTKFTVIEGRHDILIEREFDAPRELVFRAFTDPEMVRQWMGPRRLMMKIDTWDSVSGGRWKYVSIDTDGSEYGFHGVFHEVLKPDRIIQTFEFEGWPESGHVALETTRFEVLPGNRTRIMQQSVFQSVEDRDGMIESGAESGVHEGLERMDELFASLGNP